MDFMFFLVILTLRVLSQRLGGDEVLRTMWILGVSVLLELGCGPWGAGGLGSVEKAEAQPESGVSMIEATLWVSSSAIEVPVLEPVSFCVAPSLGFEPRMAGFEDGTLSVVRLDGTFRFLGCPTRPGGRRSESRAQASIM